MSFIDPLLREERVFQASAAFTEQANVSGFVRYRALCDEAVADPLAFWAKQARAQLDWHKPFTRVLDEHDAPWYRWFDDGRLNASFNCLDRHVRAGKGHRIALIFEADDGQVHRITYEALLARVCRFANALKSLGAQPDDRVVLYMPMSIEAVVAMQACARLGLTHSVVFGGFSARSLHERLVDLDAKFVITADGQRRGGKTLPLKAAVDEALAMPGAKVERVVVYQRTAEPVPWNEQRDVDWQTIEAAQSDVCNPVWVEAEHPLFVLYTSGSTGKPKGVQHSTAGYLLWALLTLEWVFDRKPDDVFWCTADVGWITGHTYVGYGPLAAGLTQVLFEGVPTYPHSGRYWEMIERHRVSVFYTAPTAIRALIKAAAQDPNAAPTRYRLDSLRLLGSVGEPINPEVWMWYYEQVGAGRCPVVDTWWQTETGGHVLAPLPGAMGLKPGSCALPLPGIDAAVVDDEGAEVPAGQGGRLVIRRPWPGMLRNLWNDAPRFQASYFPDSLGGSHYLAGDSAQRDRDGYFWILGRIDDVLNVSGHRLGTMEIESALVAHPDVAEAAVVGRPDPLTGEAIVAFVVLKGSLPDERNRAERTQTLRDWVAREIGAIAKPAEIRYGDNLPKTRSGKIMRRLLRTLAKGEAVTQDVSTLENPQVLAQFAQADAQK